MANLWLMLAGLTLTAGQAASATVRKPPMGWSSWNYLGTGPTATLLLDTADAFSSTGLLDDGYRYIIATEGWNLATRAASSGELQPAPSFTNSSVRALSDQLHARGFKFGIYGAAAFTTCAHRAGSLYHERQDARWYKAQGVDYLKYDDCGEANIQSYVKYFVMKDALAAAPGGGLDYYSYEPFQVYAADAVPQMAWVSSVGDLWRSSNDIRPSWKSVLSNAQLTNTWAPNARPGHYNDADELEIGNGHLTLAEQRSHFALWCLMKSPLIIGTDVRTLSPASLGILQNKRLIAVNQDALAAQGTLRVAFDSSGERAPAAVQVKPVVACVTDPATCAQASPWLTHCSFGSPAAAAQRWEIRTGSKGGQLLVQADTNKCLARSPVQGGHTAVSVVACDPGSAAAEQAWDFGTANVTVAQVRDAANASSCLTFNSTSLHMEVCRKEAGDKITPNQSGCRDGNCRFSGIIYQLWYLNSRRQLSSAITNIENGANQLLPMLPNFPANTPWCLASSPNLTTPPPAPPPPAVDSSMPLQVWAGPLSGGEVVVLLLNIGNGTKTITASWADIGLKSGVKAKATNLWTGEAGASPVVDSISASVASHDSAVFRLSIVPERARGLSAAALQANLNAAIEGSQPTFTVPAGEYNFTGLGNFNISGVRSALRVVADGAKLWFGGIRTEHAYLNHGVNITNSRGLHISGLSINYTDPPHGREGVPGITFNLLNCTDVVSEDITVFSAPFFSVTAFNGGGGHVFRRFHLPNTTYRPRGPDAYAHQRDAFHFTDLRRGVTLEDSDGSSFGDDFFNSHNTIMVVLRQESPTTLLLINPHVQNVASGRNTVYGTNCVLGDLRAGDKLSFFKAQNVSAFAPVTRLGGTSALPSVVSAAPQQVTDAGILAEAAALAKAMRAEYAMVSFDASDVWRVRFRSTAALPPSAVASSLVNIDSFSTPGTVVRNNTFVNTRYNIGRFKSSGGAIVNNSFSQAGVQNLEISPLLQYFEGPIPFVRDVEISGNVFSDGNRSGFEHPVHCSPFCSGTCPPFTCSRCADCTAPDNAWTVNISVHSNTIVP